VRIRQRFRELVWRKRDSSWGSSAWPSTWSTSRGGRLYNSALLDLRHGHEHAAAAHLRLHRGRAPPPQAAIGGRLPTVLPLRPRPAAVGQALGVAGHRSRSHPPGRGCFLRHPGPLGRLRRGVLDLEEGKRLAHALGESKAVILRNHGLLTVGKSVDEAAFWFITMERSCQVQLMAEAAGKPVLIDKDQAEITSGQVGTDIAGWLGFQPLYDRIVREQPDLLA